jgi:2-dehydro-3-deoxyphosphogluconate aldolase/(4S)-4-hydroxy-2-oxoglutarate aldolase
VTAAHFRAAPESAAAPIRARLIAQRVIPVLRLATAELTLRAVSCLRAAGFGTVEITLTTPGAVELIAELARADPACLVGAGTVLDVQAARACIDAGAAYLVSPGVVPGLAAMARAAGRAALVGAFTPTEVLAAQREGADIVKVFPAASGGPPHVAALHAVFPHLALCPTGGIDAANLPAYFTAGAALVGVGNALLDVAALRAGDREAVVRSARRYLELAPPHNNEHATPRS